MGLLPRRRRDRRARNPRSQRRNLKKFIPDSDSDFAFIAGGFAEAIKRKPSMFHLEIEDAAIIGIAVDQYRSALAKSIHRHTRTEQSVLAKDNARKKAEEVVRTYAGIIRSNPQISNVDKSRLRIKERPKKLSRRKCPMTAPLLYYMGAYDAGGPGSSRHVLRYKEGFDTQGRGKPEGAVRLELFVEWVPQGEYGKGAGVPAHPLEMYGRPWYLRSFTRSQFEVEFPIPPVPMLIVYWGRWADAKGNVSGWSKTVVARVEGWSGVATLPGGPLASQQIEGRREIRSDARYFIAEREVRERYVEQITSVPQGALPQLEAAPERQTG